MCTYCNEHISIGHGGKNDVKRHVERPKHVENARLARDSGVQARLTDLPWSASSSHSFQDLVTKAEVLFAQFIAEHNLPFSVGDHLTKLVKKAFPDSKIAERFQCGHTKTAAIINKALAQHYMEAIIPTARDGPITIMMDESNKRSDDKACAILVKMIDPTTFCVVNRFLDMPVCNIPTSANLFSVLEATLSKYNILWSSIKGFSSDTASVMVGKHNSVLSRVREATDNHVFDFGCVSHIANLCANSLTKALHFPVEDLLIDTYYFFHGSSKRREDYKEFQLFTGVEMEEILKHVSTRWLSLERCVGRILSQWGALRSYFNSHSDRERPGKVKRCAEAYADETVKLLCYFVHFALGRLNRFNQVFQSDGCQVLELESATKELLKAYLLKFVKADVVSTADDVTKVEYSCVGNQKADT